jgi:protein-S-isoprenylcysteine O-methyltransferase Ste14
MSQVVSNAEIVVRMVLAMLLFMAFLFIPAGTLYWFEAWLFIVVYLSFAIPAIIWLMKNDPNLLKERMSMKLPVKGWDRVIIIAFTILYFAQFIIAGFDAVRYNWLETPFILKALGFFSLIPSFVLIFLAMKENPYLYKIVVVQKGQKVVSTGPYAVVRHPMYVGVVILFIAMPLALGSLYALIPGVLMSALLVIRTHLEDRTLHHELSGYTEYAKKTRYKLIPWVW